MLAQFEIMWVYDESTAFGLWMNIKLFPCVQVQNISLTAKYQTYILKMRLHNSSMSSSDAHIAHMMDVD